MKLKQSRSAVNDASAIAVDNGAVGKDEKGQDAVTPAQMRERMIALKPLIAAKACEVERNGRLDDDVMAALRESGLFRHFVPRVFGGLEFGVTDFVEIVLPIAEACTSTAWVASFYMEHNLILSLFPEEGQRDIFGRQPYILAPAASFPPAKAVKVEGGYRLTGRWTYGTGIMHADWAMGQAIPEGEGRSEARFFVFPVDDVEVHDNWHVDGMCGTGSNDYSVDNIFVPDRFALKVVGMNDGTANGAEMHKNALYHMPMATFLALTSAIPAVGAARGALNIFQARMQERTHANGLASDRNAAHAVLGKVAVEVYHAELLLRDSARVIAALAEDGRSDDIATRAQLRARIAAISTKARDAIRLIADTAGSSIHALDNPIQRKLRDVTMITSHILHDRLAADELNGRVMLGLSPGNPLI